MCIIKSNKLFESITHTHDIIEVNKSQLSHSYNINNRLSHCVIIGRFCKMFFFRSFHTSEHTKERRKKRCNPRKKFSFCKKNVTIINLKIAGRYLLKKEEIVSRLPLMSLMWIQLNTLKYIGILKIIYNFLLKLTWSEPSIKMLDCKTFLYLCCMVRIRIT